MKTPLNCSQSFVILIYLFDEIEECKSQICSQMYLITMVFEYFPRNMEKLMMHKKTYATDWMKVGMIT